MAVAISGRHAQGGTAVHHSPGRNWYALLFRDFLRANDDHRDTWGRIKLRLAAECPDMYAYGR